MKIKTFPLQFTEDYLEKIRKAARSKGQTTKDFIMSAIQEKLTKEGVEKNA